MFPSQDGPLHLYYSAVEEALEDDPAAYGGEFVLSGGQLFYSFTRHFFGLTAPALGPIVAEKVLAGLCVAGLAYGFRYLALGVSGGASPALLLILPFLFHTALLRGFYNFNLGLALLLFMAGFWIRYSDRLGGRRSATFIGLGILLIMTHPIPLLLSGIFAAVHTLATGGGGNRRKWLHAGSIFAAAGLIWWRLSAGTGSGFTLEFHSLPERVIRTLRLMPLVPWDATLAWLAAAVSLTLLFACCVLAVRQAGGGRPATLLLLAFGVAGLAAPLMVPWRAGPWATLDERFPVIGVAFLAAAAGAWNTPPRWMTPLAGLLALTGLATNAAELKRVADQTAAVLELPSAPVSGRGIVIASGGLAGFPAGTRFAACQWAPARYFQRSRAALLNTAWLDQPQFRLQPAHPASWSYRDPPAAARELDRSPRAAAAKLDFLVSMNCRQSADSDVLAKRLGFSPSASTANAFTVYTRTRGSEAARQPGRQ